MAYNFPVADFSGLAEIPKAFEEARIGKARQTLADMASESDLSTVKGLTSLAQKAYSQGLFTDAKDLLGQANIQRATQQRGAADELLRQWVASGGLRGATGAVAAPAAVPATPNLGIVDYPAPGATGPAEAPAAAPALAPVPFLPGARSEAPAPQQAAAVPPSLNAPPPTPTEQVLSAAEKSAAPTAPVQLAGPPPTPDTVPAVNPIPPGASAGTAPTLPTGLTPPPGVPPMGAGPPPVPGRRIVETPEQALQGKTGVESVVNSPFMGAPPKAANLPGVRLILEKARNDMRQQNLTPEVQSFHMENIQRSLDGKPPYSYSEYQQFKETTGKRYEMLSTTANEFAKEGQTGHQLSETLRGMKEIASNPLFVAGAPYDPNDKSIAGRMDSMRKGIANIADNLRIMGVPEAVLPSKETLDSMNTPTALREAFTTLAHRGVIQALGGSLSRGISGPDRVYMTQAFPDLIKSKAGIELITNVLEKGAERSQIAGNIANKYMADKDFRGNSAELRLLVGDAVDRYDASHGSILTKPDGSPTGVRSAMDRIVAENARGSAPFPGSSERVSPPGATPAAVPPATPLIGSADYYRPPAGPVGPMAKPLPYGVIESMLGNQPLPRPPIGVPQATPLPYNATEAITGGANAPRGPLGMSPGGLANLISGRAQVPPVTSQSEEDAKRMAELMKMITVQSEERAKHRFRPIVGL